MSTCRLLIDFKDIPATPQILYVTHSIYEKRDWVSLIHSHAYTEFIYIENGYGEILFDNKYYSIQKGDFVMIPPNVYHTERSTDEGKLEYYVLGGSNLLSQVAYTDSYNPIIDLGNQNSHIRDLLISMYQELKQKKESYELFVESLYLQFTVHITRKKKLLFAYNELDNMRREIANAKDYIDRHYMDNITLEELAEISSLSKYHFIRKFSYYVGKTPNQYLNERRIEEAKALLKSTNTSILDIATETGFSSSSYFTQRFKALEGITPIEYRNKKRN